MLKFTADLLRKTFTSDTFPNAFVGHIGGDDFVVVLEDIPTERVLREFLAEFDARILTYYDEEHITAGCIQSHNRRGDMECFPFISLSVAAVTSQNGSFASYRNIARRSTEVKQACKRIAGSCRPPYFVIEGVEREILYC